MSSSLSFLHPTLLQIRVSWKHNEVRLENGRTIGEDGSTYRTTEVEQQSEHLQLWIWIPHFQPSPHSVRICWAEQAVIVYICLSGRPHMAANTDSFCFCLSQQMLSKCYLSYWAEIYYCISLCREGHSGLKYASHAYDLIQGQIKTLKE